MSTSPRRLILHTEASRGFGGQEIRILTEARWLSEHGWDALVACQPESALWAEARAAGIDAVAVRMRSALDVAAFRALRRVMRERAVSLVHTHSSVDSWLAAFAGRSLRLPVVRSRHVSIPILRRRALVYRLADRILTSGEGVKALVVAAGIAPERIVSVPPGVDTRRFHPNVSGKAVRDELGVAGPAVGLVANLRGSKGHAVFLEAARAIMRSAPETRFLIVGAGVGEADIRRRIDELGLGAQVLMTGFRRDIPEVMAALDVLVLPSVRSEASSQVIPQALAVGTAVVATTVGGSPELIRDGETGRLVPPDDARALAEAILGLLRDPARARAMARAGQAMVHARYSIDATMGLTTAVYEELLGR
ncbi:MAG: glycosyltransferase family 4 protein [Candidatus Rokubacteria bacterium]|nr:glycosyltransferase family 4 protein [Candidatus Rokubacteria bacterium]